MYKHEIIDGHECNVTYSKDGTTPRSACVMVGPADRAGYRQKDRWAHPEKYQERMEARRTVAATLGLTLADVRAASRFTRISESGSVRNNDGRAIGKVEI